MKLKQATSDLKGKVQCLVCGVVDTQSEELIKIEPNQEEEKAEEEAFHVKCEYCSKIGKSKEFQAEYRCFTC